MTEKIKLTIELSVSSWSISEDNGIIVSVYLRDNTKFYSTSSISKYYKFNTLDEAVQWVKDNLGVK